ncbi:MAG: hypothetical protein H0U49_12910 [Parachlamydiaceae bacterium]|nr:hypothetical protein [Parachlamydiaceae bacterium]
MKRHFFYILLSFSISYCPYISSESSSISPQKLHTLYNALDPTSVTQHLALYELYPDTKEGKLALADAWKLLTGRNDNLTPISVPLINAPINALIALINRKPNDVPPKLSENDLAVIDKIAYGLANRKLKGYYATSEQEVLALESKDIDLARGLFLSQFGTSKDAWQQLKTYEAYIDLMALQIRARIPKNASSEQIIAAINHYVFYEMGFRFPPHSLLAKGIDPYTFLPSVLDSHQGVCLGVSILYLSIAQRLQLPLEIITPPGHIYIRYNSGSKIINIETTARGIHIDCEEYLSVDTMQLQQRQIKEVIGMAHFNQAAAFLTQKHPEQSVSCYEKALMYHPDDMLTKELMGYCCILAGQEKRGRRLLQEIANYAPYYAVSGDSTAEDYLSGNADKDALEATLMHVDETRESILTKQKALQISLEQFPRFRAGLFALAATWLQLHRFGEALEILAKYEQMEPNDPTAEYYLAALYAERYNFPKAWIHLRRAEVITANRGHYPKTLKKLRQQLQSQSPD